MSLISTGDHYCNACRRSIPRFYNFGEWTLCCPLCNSVDRERLVIAALDSGALQFGSGRPRILHVAPGETALARRFEEAGMLIRADLNPERYAPGTICLDLQDMGDLGPLDFVLLSHVLEHVPDDRLALSELFQRLAPAGQVVIQVPLIYPETFEAPAEMTPAERDGRLGGSDHVRAYGPDIERRIADAGFEVRRIQTADLPETDAWKCGLRPDTVFVAHKPE